MRALLLASVVVACSGPAKTGAPIPPPVPAPAPSIDDPREVHLRNVRQLTFGGENAEAYWSPDGESLVFQTTRVPYACDQIMTLPARGQGVPEPTLISTGVGRTTCAYYDHDASGIVYASTHHLDAACPPPPDRAQGYVWALYDYALYRSSPTGGESRLLADVPNAYDAEATVCAKDGSIVFTSDRDGDLELYRMDADGQNVRRLTHTPGYDGGAFFSADCSQLVWRASRPTGDALADYQRLLAADLVRPTQLEIWIGDADGGNARQVTHLGAASFAPFLSPDGQRILFSTNYPDPRGREFDLWSISPRGTNLERITFADGFDGFPMWSPDGKTLAFGSNRRDLAPGDGPPRYRVTGGPVGETDTNVFVADWIEEGTGPGAQAPGGAERIAADVAFLADDRLAGRSPGSDGDRLARKFVVEAFADAGLEPGVAGAFEQPFSVATQVLRDAATRLVIDGVEVTDGVMPLSMSASATARGKVVGAGWGLVTPGGKPKVDDYRRKNVKQKIVVVHRFAPGDGQDAELEAAASFDAKVLAARSRGAAALIIVDDGDPKALEAPAPELAVRRAADAGIPVVVVTREVGARVRAARGEVEVKVALTVTMSETANVVGVMRGADPALAPIVLGAHLDHLGWGGPGSLHKVHGHGEPTQPAIHNGADDNASGIAALVEIARELGALRATTRPLPRDVWFVAFGAEEMGLLGSRHLVEHPPAPGVGPGAFAMLNLDMVGRLRGNTVSVLGAESATEWATFVEPACAAARLGCALGGSGYGASDHMSFYVAGVPVLHFFTGAHADYHQPSDDAERVHAGGAAQIAKVVAGVVTQLATPTAKLTYQKTAAVGPGGDRRRFGASLGTIPSYDAAPGSAPGMVLADVVPDGPAAKAGLRGGDRIVKIDALEIRSVEDLMVVLGRARPGQRARLAYERDGVRQVVDVVFGQPRSR